MKEQREDKKERRKGKRREGKQKGMGERSRVEVGYVETDGMRWDKKRRGRE